MNIGSRRARRRRAIPAIPDGTHARDAMKCASRACLYDMKQQKRRLRQRPSPDCTLPPGVRRPSMELLTETECVGAVVVGPRRRGVNEAVHKLRDGVCHRQRWRCQRRMSARSCPTQRDPQLQRDPRYQGARLLVPASRASSSLRRGVGRRPISQQLGRRLLHIEADGERCLAQARHHRQRRRQLV
jgi:hypothetical protein